MGKKNSNYKMHWMQQKRIKRKTGKKSIERIRKEKEGRIMMFPRMRTVRIVRIHRHRVHRIHHQALIRNHRHRLLLLLHRRLSLIQIQRLRLNRTLIMIEIKAKKERKNHRNCRLPNEEKLNESVWNLRECTICIVSKWSAIVTF